MRYGFWMVLMIGLVACGGQPDDGVIDKTASGANKKVYRHAMDQGPSTLDPVRSANVYANFIVVNAYDTLYAYKYLARPYQLKPNLAQALPEVSADGLTYTIKLKPNVHFIDDESFAGGQGREVIAEDVVYSLKRHFDPNNLSQGAWLWQGRIVGLDEWKEAGSDYAKPVAGLQAIDRHTLQIKLIKPYPQLTHTLAQGFSAVVPKEAVALHGEELSIRPVGSGPFKLTRFDSTKAVLVKNEAFRQEPIDLMAEGYDEALHGQFGIQAIAGRSPPFVDQLEFHFIAEGVARWGSFAKGNEVNFTLVPSEQMENMLASKQPLTLQSPFAEDYFYRSYAEAGFVFSAFNFEFPEFGYNAAGQDTAKSKALRCAINKSFDWQDRNNRFYSGIGTVFPGIIPPMVPEYDPEQSLDSVTHDPEGAKALLKQAGWTADNLPELVYGGAASVTTRQFFDQFQGFLVKIGYPRDKVIYKPYSSFGDLARAWKKSQLPYVSKGWGLDFPDAENTLQLFYGPNGSPGSNDANYRNPEYDRLYEQAAVMQPGPKRTALYRQMNQMVIDDCAVVSGIARTRLMMWHKNVIAYPDRGIVGGYYTRYVDMSL